MGVERITLEHHGGTPVSGAHVIGACAVDQQVAAGNGFQTGNHAQCGGLAATRRSDEDEKLALDDIQVNTPDDFDCLKIFADCPQ